MSSREGRRRCLSALGVGVAVALLLPAAASSRAAEPQVSPGTVVDRALPGHLAAGGAAAIVTWDPAEASREEVRAHLEEAGIASLMLDVLPMAIACMAGPGDLPALTGTPGAISVWGDEVLTPALSRSVPTAFNGDPEDIWSGMGATGDGVTIAVIDTGIDGAHPDLAWPAKTIRNVKVLLSHNETLGPGNDVPGCPTAVGEDEEDTEIESGHGTHLASVAAGDGTASGGRSTGMAPGASLLGLASINAVEFPSGEVLGFRPSLLRAVAAVDYALLEGLDRGFVTKVALLGFTTDGLYDPYHPLSYALQYLAEFNITPVLPAGNDGPDASDCSDAATCHINKYSASPYAVVVGATPKDRRDRVEDYSSRGDPQPRTVYGAPFRYEPTLVAPGTDVMAAHRAGAAFLPPLPGKNRPGASGSDQRHRLDLDYQALTGTSVAAAHVAGAIAVMQEAAVDAKGCYLTFNQVRQILRDTSTSMAHASNEVGAGALDATAAVWGARFAPRVDSRNPWDCPG